MDSPLCCLDFLSMYSTSALLTSDCASVPLVVKVVRRKNILK